MHKPRFSKFFSLHMNEVPAPNGFLCGKGCEKLFLCEKCPPALRLDQRIRMFLQVFREIHMPADSGATYLNWLEGICAYCAQHQVAEDMASRAHLFCAEMFEKYPDRVLLHGDLHHDNLLLRTDGSYAMIDPKGVVGPAIMDLPRFILNEPDADHACSDRQHIEEVIRLLGEQSGYPVADIGKLFYMETVLTNIWCLEDGEEMDREQMEFAEHCL